MIKQEPQGEEDESTTTSCSPELWEPSQPMPFHIPSKKVPWTGEKAKRKGRVSKIGQTKKQRPDDETSLDAVYKKYKEMHKEWQEKRLHRMPARMQDFQVNLETCEVDKEEEDTDVLQETKRFARETMDKIEENALLRKRNGLALLARMFQVQKFKTTQCGFCVKTLDTKDKYIWCFNCNMKYCMKCFKIMLPMDNAAKQQGIAIYEKMDVLCQTKDKICPPLLLDIYRYK